MTVTTTYTYVAGFLLTQGLYEPRVLLIRKNRPAWQAGKLNGVGGKVEPGETPLGAMMREFDEEAGLLLADWQDLAVLTGDGFCVHFFFCWTEPPIFAHARAQTDEEIVRFPVSDALRRSDLIPNLRVLIPLALDTSGIVKPVRLVDERAQAA